MKKSKEAITKEMQVELASGILQVYRQLRKECEKLPSLMIEVTSREGNVKPQIHPIVEALNSTGEALRKHLSELMVTPKSKGTARTKTADTTDDPLATLIDNLSQLPDD